MRLTWWLFGLIGAFMPFGMGWEIFLLGLFFLSEISFGRKLADYRIIFILLIIVAFQIFFIQLLFCRQGELIWQGWFIKIYSGFGAAAALGISRTGVIALFSGQFLLRSSAEDLMLMLVGWKVPYRYAMLIPLTARFFPVLKSEYAAICAAQAVRGMPNERAWDKLKLFFPTFLPFLFRSLRRSGEIALALELRGYGMAKQRTFLKEIALKAWEKTAIVLLLLGLIIMLVM